MILEMHYCKALDTRLEEATTVLGFRPYDISLARTIHRPYYRKWKKVPIPD